VLTGTPVNDDAFDLWGLLHVVAPDWHPGKTRYGDRYVNIGYGLFGGIAVLGLKAEAEAEFRQVTMPLYRRILKAAVLPHLPPKLPDQVRLTPMTPRQAKAYREMEELQLTQLNELLVAPNHLASLTRLLQFAAASARVEKKTDAKGNVRDVVVLEDPSAKVDDLVELLDEMGQEPLIVAAVSRQLIELAAARLGKHGISYGLITGGVSVTDRAMTVQKFQAGQIRVILVVLEAGAEGLTLTRARVTLFMQEDWRPDLNSQMRDRNDRIGAEVHDSLQVIRQVTPGTVEERKHDVLGRKQVRIEEVLRDRETLTRLLGG
jgi:SNF2 family DNA or RNA helicase